MDPIRVSIRISSSRLPRTRGDGPAGSRTSSVRTRASPHTRGWTAHEPTRRARAQGFPAHAGMDPGRPAAVATSSGLPRTRGDGPVTGSPSACAVGASPHTRGWTGGARTVVVRPLGFPAHAGMDPRSHRPGPCARGLPRTRGDGPSALASYSSPPGASPHTRGWTHAMGTMDPAAPGFPAHAGMDPFRGADPR